MPNTDPPKNDNPTGNANVPKTNGSVLTDVIEIPTPETRPLKCYAFDPSHGKFSGNEMTLNVK